MGVQVPLRNPAPAPGAVLLSEVTAATLEDCEEALRGAGGDLDGTVCPSPGSILPPVSPVYLLCRSAPSRASPCILRVAVLFCQHAEVPTHDSEGSRLMVSLCCALYVDLCIHTIHATAIDMHVCC